MGIMSELFTASKGSCGGRRGDVVSVAPQAQYANAQPAEAWTDPTQQEQAAFEQAIDVNPLDPVTHGAYADWLQEHGQHDEAAFRRAMGDWVSQGGMKFWPNNSEHTSWGVSVKRDRLPGGVDWMFGPTTDSYMNHNWRGTEDHFRKSFMTNLQRQREQQPNDIQPS